MVRRSGARAIPVEFAVLLADRSVVDARVAAPHQTVLVKLPIFVAIGTKPVARVIMIFIGKAHGDAVASEGPQFLDQPVIELPLPFPREKGDDGGAALEDFRTVPPFAVERI